ncbi:MAG: hypothetical protein R2697_08015 [Ilumatobacteraceae bacterium]
MRPLHQLHPHLVHLVADHLGTIAKNAYTPAKNDGTPTRKADTRL